MNTRRLASSSLCSGSPGVKCVSSCALPSRQAARHRSMRLAATAAAVTTLIATGAGRALGQAPRPGRSNVVIVGRSVTDTLLGIVEEDGSALPLGGALIHVVSGPARDSRTTTTDSAGRWRIVFATGTGDYLVYASAPGYATQRVRVTHEPAATGYAARVTTRLKRVVPLALKQVTVRAPRVRIAREDIEVGPTGPGTGASEYDAAPVAGALSPDAAADLSALAATTPGVIRSNAGISVLGLGANANRVTLNGLDATITALPRDAVASVKVRTSAFDPAKGWFDGAEIATTLAPGGEFTIRRAHIDADAPQFQATDRRSRLLGEEFGGAGASVVQTGSVLHDAFVYDVAGELRTRMQTTPSLASAGDGLLRAVGVAPDTASLVIELLRRDGIPIGSLTPVTRRATTGSVVLRVDRAFLDSARTPRRRNYGLLFAGSVARQANLGIDPTVTATRGGRSDASGGTVQGDVVTTSALGNRMLALRSGVSIRRDVVTPSVAGPGAVIALDASGVAPGSDRGVTQLAAGGNGALASRRRLATWETLGSWRWTPLRAAGHTLAVTSDARYDRVAGNRRGDDELGTFYYPSISAFAANRPSAFTRTIPGGDATAATVNGFVAVGDEWRATDRLRLLGGVRGEASRFIGRPRRDSALAAALDVRSDAAPALQAISPRLGFTLNLVPARDAIAGSSFGRFRYVGSSTLRGGVGIFRRFVGPDVLLPTLVSQRADGSRSLYCVDDAVPPAPWESRAIARSTPSTCAAGATSSDAATAGEGGPRAFAVLAPGFRAPESRRTNLALVTRAGPAALTVEGVLSDNRYLRGTTDANWRGTTRFLVTDEKRSVYVPASAITPTTGVTDPSFARRDARYAAVSLRTADLRSRSRQLTVTVAPREPSFGWYAAAAYTLGSVRETHSGFDGLAFGDPRAEQRTRGDLDVRHQIRLQAGTRRLGSTWTLDAVLSSGLPYTPTVLGDVNGDGIGGDRAFVFDPSTVAETTFAAGMRALLTDAPRSATRCLRAYLGSPAPRNACTGPWWGTVNGRVAVPAWSIGHGRTATLALSLTNLLAGVDELLGTRLDLASAASAYPDPVLYIVRGFDTTAKRFRYDVNPRFGGRRAELEGSGGPFRVTIDMSFTLHPPLPEQQVARWLRPARAGDRPRDVEQIVRRYRPTVPNPYTSILENSDSLLLSPEQTQAIRELENEFRTRSDSAWRSFAEYVRSLPADFRTSDVLRAQDAVTSAVWEMARTGVQARIPDVLTSAQIELLPWPADILARSRGHIGLRLLPGS